MNKILNIWNNLGLIHKIFIGMIVGVILALFVPKFTFISIIGNLFVGALKAIAPILVFFLVISALSKNRSSNSKNMKNIIILYIFGTLAAAITGTVASFIFPITLKLNDVSSGVSSLGDVNNVIQTILLKMVDNPVNALVTANYIGILTWAIIFGVALKNSNNHIKDLLETLSEATSLVLRWIIQLAPIGIMSLVFTSVSESGLDIFKDYFLLLLILVGSMLVVALVINPLIIFFMIYENPYPLVFKCLKESGITAFFTRSSAANIPINMEICKKFGLNKDIYSVSIPLGATINMAGASITISVLTLAAVHTLGIHVDFLTAFILSILATISACGASGVTGGSLLLIPVACSLFGISNDIAMQVVGVGFIIGIIQDSCETALNSSSDVLFTIATEFREWKKEGKKLVIPK
ncbi:serine/threonine transporter SstT [Pseudostreptobacillus hongkongensis]|uniref:serine/threonine transporter SstT n=1 Tax=Pseudostreptobacillus hongkongensis TaxID=1162717 RepID=UPI00083304CD|nr:serine/threonine transporter SstT [Pseudostreptobacillus hongkongensis]